MTRANTHARILTYWRAIELFSAQRIPKPDPNHSKQPVFRVKASEPLPWQATHTLQRREPAKNLVWRHIVYGGLFTSDITRDLLEQHLGKNPEVFDRPDKAAHCLFAFAVNQNGQPLRDTFALSSLGWAIGRTLTIGPMDQDWLAGFVDAEEAAKLNFEHRHALRTPVDLNDENLDPNETGEEIIETEPTTSEEVNNDTLDTPQCPLDHNDLIAEVNSCITQLGVDPLITKPMTRVRSILMNKKHDNTKNEPVLLNSFFVDDLDHVAKYSQTNVQKSALTDYLKAPEELAIASRIDVRKYTGTVFETLSPAFFPIARWPERHGHPLVTSQQFAINTIVRTLSDSTGIAAVNGPPGTGKTTLLRDLIANVVVERAMKLAELTSPEDAFESSSSWSAGDYPRTIWHWKESFHGHEIVIASSNNGAVENVTLEIPGLESIDPNAIEDADHFKELASHVLGEDAWGLMAAKLGNRANCSEFRSRFWFDRNADEKDLPKLPGMKSILDEYCNDEVDWQTAVETFIAAVSKSKQLRYDRQQVLERGSTLRKLKQDVNNQKVICDDLNEHLTNAKAALEQAVIDETLARKTVNESTTICLNHRRFRPSLLEIIFTLGRAFREWRIRDVHLKSTIDTEENHLKRATEKRLGRGKAIVDKQRTYNEAHDQLNTLTNKLAATNAEQELASQTLGIDIPDENSNQWIDDTKRELSAPWADKAWNATRSQVFIATLALHRSFLSANASKMRQSLHAAMDLLDGSVPATAPADAVANAWRALFFVVPVVSTTFSSFARLFPQLGAESLGWLLIDEAGQALPQHAVGAIWRTRRVIVVGDPLQLEPITSISLKAQEALQQHHEVDHTWAPGQTSVQGLADRIAQRGTYVENGEDKVWVGSPLRVHRRCTAPMMDICNAIAYNGLMVDGTLPKASIPWPKSAWIDIHSAIADGHWIPAEGDATIKLLEELVSLGANPARIFLISPFRAVADRLRVFNKKFPGIQAGTVHTTQGKEADIVVLVLGSDPANAGARQWASSKPNLLNVAVSRAKQRLYVIGDLSKWRRCNYFSTCATQLERHVERERSEDVEVDFEL